MLIAVLEFTIADRKALIVVPMFATRINGTALRSLTIFFATKGTTNEVVTELDRIAAVVSTPQVNDFSGLRKKNRWKRSGEPKPSKLVSTFRKNRIEPKRINKDKIISRKLLPIEAANQSVITLNPPPNNEKFLPCIGPIG